MCRSLLLFVVFFVVVQCGCGSQRESTASAPRGPQAVADSQTEVATEREHRLGRVLELSQAGDIDAAVDQFVARGPDSWLNPPALPELEVTETEFQQLSRSERAEFQTRVIERVGEIKSFARALIDRASEAKARGELESAERYIASLNAFGRQLRNSDTVSSFRETWNALANLEL